MRFQPIRMEGKMQVRDCVKEFRRVKASELRPNPRNWKVHTDFQRNALRGLLEQIGFAGAVLARELPDGTLELIDGHERCNLTADMLVPTLILDVTAEEADLLLATFDPISSLAGASAPAIHKLIDHSEVFNQYTRQLMEDLRDKYPLDSSSAIEQKKNPEVLLDQAIQLRPSREYVVIVCDEDGGLDFERLKSALGLKQVRRGGYRADSPFDDIGTERTVRAKRLLELLKCS